MRISAAPVRPRFISPLTGDALTLEESVVDAVRRFGRGVIEISGPSGSGKTVALQHLEAVLPDDLGVRFFGRHKSLTPTDLLQCAIVEVDSDAEPFPRQVARFALAPWGADEIIEFCFQMMHRRSPTGRFQHQTDS